MEPSTENRRPQRIIDAKLPLTWLLSTTGGLLLLYASLLWRVFAQTSKIDLLILQTTELERRQDDATSASMAYSVTSTTSSASMTCKSFGSSE